MYPASCPSREVAIRYLVFELVGYYAGLYCAVCCAPFGALLQHDCATTAWQLLQKTLHLLPGLRSDQVAMSHPTGVHYVPRPTQHEMQ